MKKVTLNIKINVPNDFECGDCKRCPFKDIKEYFVHELSHETNHNRYDVALDRAIEALKQPERKKGKWILSDEQWQEDVDNGNYRFICSECGKSDLHSKAVIVPFCWNCGAKMEEEDG